MVVIKDFEMPKSCDKCSLMGTDGKDFLSPMMCIPLWATKHGIKHCVKGKIRDDCPLVEIKPKTGHWIEEFNDLEGEVRFTCSSCGKYQLFGTDFCYHCGVKMVEPQESEK